MQESKEMRTQTDTNYIDKYVDKKNVDKSASWPLLAAGFLSQACPSAAPLFHSCAMLVSLRQARRNHNSRALK